MKKIFVGDTAFKIYSVLIAVLLWVIVVYGQNPETEKTVKGVVIAYSNAEALEGEGLCVADNTPITVDLKLKGKRLLLTKIDQDNIYASVFFNETKRVGEHDLNINVKLPIDGVTIVDKNPYTAKVRVEKIKKVDLPVEILYDGTPKDTQTMVRAKSLPEKVSLWGPESVMAKVLRAVVTLDASQVQDGEKIISAYQILDVSGNNITDNTNIRKNIATVEVYPDVLSVKSVPIEVRHTGNVAQGYVLTATTLTPALVNLAGKVEALNGLISVVLSDVDLSGLSQNTTKTVKLKLPEGVISVGDNDSVSVALQIEPVEDRTVEISTVSFENMPSQLKSTVEGTPISVAISGAKSLLEAPQLIASVDLNGVTEGRHYLPLNLKAREGIEILDKYSIWVEISK